MIVNGKGNQSIKYSIDKTALSKGNKRSEQSLVFRATATKIAGVDETNGSCRMVDTDSASVPYFSNVYIMRRVIKVNKSYSKQSKL